MTEAIRGLSPRDISPAFIAATRDAIFADIARQGRNELLRFSKFSERKDSLSPGAPEFESLPTPTQNLIRRSIASVALNPIENEIARVIRSGVFKEQRVFDETSALLEGTSARNPFPAPEEPETQLSIAEWQDMVKIAAEDPTLMRLLNKRFSKLPHSMRSYFRRIGTLVWFIDDELIPEIEERLEKEGIPRTYRKRPFRKIEIPAESPIGTERLQKPQEVRHRNRIRRIHFRHRRPSIWSRY